MKLRASPILDRWGRQHAIPVAPAWFSDAVERYARESGRNSVTRWESAVGCFVSHLSRRTDDPVLGKNRADDGEPVYWHEFKKGARPHPILGVAGGMVPGWVPLDIEQMGVDGVLNKLRRENTWSGRGEFSSHEAAVDAVEARNAAVERDKRRNLRGAIEGPLKATLRRARGHAQSSVPDNITQ